MAEQLEKFRNKFVIVYEKNNIIVGTIPAVQDDAILVLKEAFKITVFGGTSFIAIAVEKLFVSICEITEFAPIPFQLCDKILNNLKQLNSIKLLLK